ncbi:Uncharacterized conserved protein, DUF427 family [Geodermatophilus telluris]|uniref:Uncharacterized conserved protein, DUF427 family n=1 Tax=Geodermatophilus telluris TaxID=1190417 RepID=A0A1G6JTX5_9ACTN|nr:DUF427 domain-containing protein [Geodermatophilus telluris]SDC21855.1 Uncharacterized conserved protein, DUF427 family [Geodermatophilus telluris]
MPDHPRALVPTGHVEPVPRRVRAVLGGVVVLDTLRARYVWEWPPYPQYVVPVDDVAPGVLADEGETAETPVGTAARHGLRAGGRERPGAALVHTGDRVPELAGHVRLDWAALDAWFEEDEEVFVHPRNPYSRVDAIRSSRRVRVERDGVVLAESASPVLVFETGLPTRSYLPRTDVRWEHLAPSTTVTQCPYKGRTSGYWSLLGVDDVAWSYDFPTRELTPIAGLVAFYDEEVDVVVDGVRQERPRTHMR